jgi:hypothetical protein
MKRVYFDESGYVGANLFDLEQPFFALASCSFEDGQQENLFDCFAGTQMPELKFSSLRKSGKGKRMILSFLESDAISKETVGIFVIHHPWMVITKYCDLVIEPSMKKSGINFFEDGMNLATANLLFLTMPTMVGPLWRQFLEGFVKAVRSKESAHFQEWRTQAELIYSDLEFRDPQSAMWIAPLLLFKPDGSDLFPYLSSTELDPVLPSFTFLVDHWGKKVGKRFEAVTDSSKPLAANQWLIETFSQTAVPEEFIFRRGDDAMEFPLSVERLEFADSKTERTVQLADVLAGSAVAAFKSHAYNEDDAFGESLCRIFDEKGIIVDAMVPTGEVCSK